MTSTGAPLQDLCLAIQGLCCTLEARDATCRQRLIDAVARRGPQHDDRLLVKLQSSPEVSCLASDFAKLVRVAASLSGEEPWAYLALAGVVEVAAALRIVRGDALVPRARLVRVMALAHATGFGASCRRAIVTRALAMDWKRL